MAIEIKELVVRLTVRDGKESAAPAVKAENIQQADKKKLVEECVNRVLEILDSKSDR